MLDTITESQGFQRALLWAKAAQQMNAALITTISVGFQHQRSASVERLSALRRWATHAQASIAATLIVCGAFVLWNISLDQVNVFAMNDLGLASVLPTGCFIALGGITLGFCFTLLAVRGRWRPWLLTIYLLALIFMLYATPTLVEQAPRFQVTYWLAGHTEYIMRNGSVQRYLDAYFNWPGFFVLTGLFTSVGGLQSVMALAPWASLAYNLLYLIPMYLIYTSATRDHRIVWLGLWFFYITDWVWQDYFSPQGLNLFFYLVILAILLKWFKTPQARPVYLVERGTAWVMALPGRMAAFREHPPRFAFRHVAMSAWGTVSLRSRRIALAISHACVSAVSAAWSGVRHGTEQSVATVTYAWAHPQETRIEAVARLRWLGATLAQLAQTVSAACVQFAKMTPARLRAMPDSARCGVVTIRGAVVLAAGSPQRFYQRHEEQFHPWLRISDTPLMPTEHRKRVGLLVALIAIFFLSLVSHPVTPFFVVLSVGALVFSGQCAPRWLPILMVAMILGWDLTVATPYMAGHLAADLSTFGNLGKAASANLTDRLSAGSAQHQFIAETRVALTGAIWGLAILGAALRWRNAAIWYAGNAQWSAGSLFKHDLSILLLAIMPLFMIVAQPYGGEMAMRSYLLSLPLVIFFAASAFYMPASDVLARAYQALSARVAWVRASWVAAVKAQAYKIEASRRSFITSTVMTSAACLLLLAGFMFARYGNERADFMTYNEVNAVAYLYSVAPAHAQLLAGWSGTPWRYQDLEQYTYASLYPQANGAELLQQHETQTILTAAENKRFTGTYVIITRGQMMQAEMFNGVTPLAFTAVEQQLIASGRFVQIYRNSDAVILMYLRPAPLPEGKYPNHPYSATPIAREFAK